MDKIKIEAKKLEKHEDNRGWLVEILRDDEISGDMKQIYFSISKPGTIRGNHYHKRKVEWFCVVKGKAKLTLRDNKTKKTKKLVLSGSDPRVVKIPSNVIHIIENIGRSEMYLISVVNKVFDPDDPDTFTPE